jgi:hypothetical protein
LTLNDSLTEFLEEGAATGFAWFETGSFPASAWFPGIDLYRNI